MPLGGAVGPWGCVGPDQVYLLVLLLEGMVGLGDCLTPEQVDSLLTLEGLVGPAGDVAPEEGYLVLPLGRPVDHVWLYLQSGSPERLYLLLPLENPVCPEDGLVPVPVYSVLC